MRIKSADELGNMGGTVRQQLERALGEGGDGLEGFRRHLGTDVVAEGGRLRQSYPEEAAGRAFVQWADETRIQLANGRSGTVGDYLVHNANGGARTRIEGAILIGQGVRPGFPDYTLYIPIEPFHGLVLELKAPDGDKPKPKQLEHLSRLEGIGYCAAVAWGADEAIESVCRYLGIERRSKR